VTQAEHVYRYASPSELVDDGRRLMLATSSPDAGEANPHFFEGRVKHPRLVAELLTTVHSVVGARFFVPANTLAKILAAADPVVTARGGILRFEGLSACASTYVRVDLLPDSYEGDLVGQGTTNVDFNAPMRAALARVRDASGLHLAVGRDRVVLRAGPTEVTEKKVALPTRWIRSFLEVQSYMASMSPRLDVAPLDALRFLRSAPKSQTTRTPLFVSKTAAGLRASTQQSEDAVRFTHPARLKLLESVLPRARAMRIYADAEHQSSAWVVEFEGARLTLVLSAEVWRAFSGEGHALHALMGSLDADHLARVKANLLWTPRLDRDELAVRLGLPPEAVADALRVLGVCGSVGYDVTDQAYFHRELPLDLSMVEDMHPRLTDARALVDAGAVTVRRRDPLEAEVRSREGSHVVRDVDGTNHCTCTWFARHRGLRGPCKHVLAAEWCGARSGAAGQ